MTKRIKTAGLVMLALISVSPSVWAIDYKTMSTEDLRNLRGTMQSASQIERHAYNNEMLDRLEQMTPAQRQDFMESGKRMDNTGSSGHRGGMSNGSRADNRDNDHRNDSRADNRDDHNRNDSRADNRDDHSWNDSGGSGSGSSGGSGSGSGSGSSSGGHNGNDSGSGSGGGHNGNDSGSDGGHGGW